ncbi:MAG TPA: hypothetical protein VM076_04265 [Gemmatimonadaceae bacterium]|nr:hypothetical protein [Gemmatimonadaceae bacterium]
MVGFLATAACVAPHKPGEARPGARAGIAIVGSGGVAGLQRTMVLDSATAHFMTVTRAVCSDSCAPFDSASGALAESDVEHIYAVVQREHVFALREAYGVCDGCVDQALVTTAVFANRQRKIITSNSYATPEVLGRVHIAVAEAIRTAREAR